MQKRLKKKKRVYNEKDISHSDSFTYGGQRAGSACPTITVLIML